MIIFYDIVQQTADYLRIFYANAYVSLYFLRAPVWRYFAFFLEVHAKGLNFFQKFIESPLCSFSWAFQDRFRIQNRSDAARDIPGPKHLAFFVSTLANPEICSNPCSVKNLQVLNLQTSISKLKLISKWNEPRQPCRLYSTTLSLFY